MGGPCTIWNIFKIPILIYLSILNNIDQILVLVYLLIVLVLGFLKSNNKNEENFIFAGRKLTIPSFVATLVATWYGGILEVGRFSYKHGIVTWVIFGFTYYFAAVLFGKYIAPQILNKKVYTIPSFLFKTYGKYPAIIGIIIILFLTSPAPYLKMLANIFQYLWHIPEILALSIGTIISLVYTYRGGFQSIIRTDKFQFILMFTGFIIILTTAIIKYGGISFLLNNTPNHTFSIPGNLNWGFTLIWAFIAFVTFIDPSFYQRTFAGNSLKTIQKGIKWSILFWFIFDGLTIFTGIYASAILPNNIIVNPYLALADLILPTFAKGLFIISLLSVIMSTIDSFAFISAYTIGRDMLSIINPSKNTSFTVVKTTQFSLLITAILSIILAYLFPHAIDLWYTSGSFAVPVLLIPVIMGLYGKKIKYPLLNMLFSIIITSYWFYYGLVKGNFEYPLYPMGIEPMYPGLIVSILFFILTNHKKQFSTINN